MCICELAVANRTLRLTPPDKLPLLRERRRGRERAALTAEQAALIERLAYLLPVIAARVPWRSNCLVQALAARRWLKRVGIVSDLCLGVRKNGQGFQAHAWLKVGDRIVTGGDISSYAELPVAQLGRLTFSN